MSSGLVRRCLHQRGVRNTTGCIGSRFNQIVPDVVTNLTWSRLTCGTPLRRNE
jgi:hypothetical protein